jgi:hypothetical protein
MAQAGEKVPERLNGRLAARVALSYDNSRWSAPADWPPSPGDAKDKKRS